MKKTTLLPVVGLLAGLLVACGGGNTPASSTSKGGATSKESHAHTFDTTRWESNDTNHWHPATCGHTTQKDSTAAHTFVKDAEASKDATCKADGVLVEKCSVCNYVKRTVLPAGEHNWGAAAETKKEGDTTYKVQKCATCGTDDLFFKANDHTELKGTIKTVTDDTVKLSAKGDYTVYKFTVTKAFTGKLFLYGWVDHIGDSTDNTGKSMFSGKNNNNETPNFEFSINGQVVEVTNRKTYGEMGLKEYKSDNDYMSTTEMCEVGACSFAAGELTIKYERTESYNLNVDSFHFVGTLA